MGKFILRAFLLIILLSSLQGCSQPESVTIGAVLVLTDEKGASLPVESEFLKGMEFAIEAINSDGGIDGKLLKLEYRDCKGDLDLARTQFRELATLSPLVVITIYSHISKGLAPLAEELRTIQMVTLATAEDLTKGAPYTFRYWPQSSEEGEASLAVIHHLKVRRLGLVNIDNLYGNSFSDVLSAMAGRQGITAEKVVYTDVSSREFHKDLEVLRKFDAVVFSCFPPDIMPLTKLLKSTLPGVPLIGTSTLASPSFVIRPALDGIYVPAPLIYRTSRPEVAVIGAAFTKEYGMPFSHYSGIGYDMVSLISQLAAQSPPTAEGIKKTIEAGFVYPGLFGNVESKPGGGHFSFRMYPAVISDEHLKYLGN